uniref:Glucosinolate transporter n=1 Tax=Phyllotreta armoraciae TaxID=1553667 RepID=A0A858Z6T4_9CUCU|nr:glucosinolate transporter [Phyllotreta armoraciae]
MDNQNENNQNEKSQISTSRKPDTLFLYISVITAHLISMASGASMVWTSPVLGKLYLNDTEVNPIGRPITTIEVSMLAAIPTLSNIFGILFMPKLSDIFGRKRYLLCSGLVMLLSGVGLAFSNNVLLMIITRCIFGFPGAWTVVCLYAAEVSEDHNRGKFGCYFGIFQQIGHLFGFVMGPFFSVKHFTLIITSPLLVFVVIFMILPETPKFLLAKDREDECKNVLRKLRSNKSEEEIESDFEKLKENQIKPKEEQGKITDLIKKRESMLAVILGLLPLLTKYCSGVTIIFAFLAPFFDQAGTSLSGDIVAIIIAVFKITFFILTSFIIEKNGRRKMLLISSTSIAIPLFLLGIYFYLQSIDSPIIAHLQWIPLTCLLFTVSFFGLGLGPIVEGWISELPLPELRAVTSSLVHSIGSVVGFALTFMYPIISEFGIQWCVWWFSMNCVVGAILMYFFLPEIQGKSFDEIQEILKNYDVSKNI